MDFADVTLPGAKAIHVNLAEKDVDRRRPRRVRRPGPCAVLLRRGRRRDTGHREDQLHRAPPPHRPAHGRAAAAARVGHRVHLVRRRSRLGSQPRPNCRSTWTRLTSTPPSQWVADHGKRRLLSTKQAICAYVARQAFPFLQAGDPHQRHLPGADRHPARPGQQGYVARLRRRLPGRDGHRGLDPARAGVPARLPVQRRGRLDQWHHVDHRRRLHQLGRCTARSPRPPTPPASSSGGWDKRKTDAWLAVAADLRLSPSLTWLLLGRIRGQQQCGAERATAEGNAEAGPAPQVGERRDVAVDAPLAGS